MAFVSRYLHKKALANLAKRHICEEFLEKCNLFAKIFAYVKNFLYLCSVLKKNKEEHIFCIAGIMNHFSNVNL